MGEKFKVDLEDIGSGVGGGDLFHLSREVNQGRAFKNRAI
jgi:hypothetical protein